MEWGLESFDASLARNQTPPLHSLHSDLTVNRDENCKSIRSLVNFKWEKASSKCFIIVSAHHYDMLKTTDGYQPMYCLPRLSCILNVRFSWEITKPLVVPRQKCLTDHATHRLSTHRQRKKKKYINTHSEVNIGCFLKMRIWWMEHINLYFFCLFWGGGGGFGHTTWLARILLPWPAIEPRSQKWESPVLTT